MHSGKKPQCILVKSDEFENSYSLLYFFLNPVYVAARSLRSLRSNNLYLPSAVFIAQVLVGPSKQLKQIIQI